MAYTMLVGKKGAFVLLTLVVLWIATPALAFLKPNPRPSCCRGMSMGDCSSPAMMQCSHCCSAQPADPPAPAIDPGTLDHQVCPAPSPVPVAWALPEAAAAAYLPAGEMPLPPGSPGGGSILRI